MTLRGRIKRVIGIKNNKVMNAEKVRELGRETIKV